MINNIGIIPDGTRRWAGKTNQPLALAYEKAMETLGRTITQFFAQADSTNIVCYLLSYQNLQRNNDDLSAVLKAESHFLKDTAPPIAEKWQSKMIAVGVENIDPSRGHDLQDYVHSLRAAETASRDNDQRTLYFLAGYDPILEVRRAMADGNFTGVESLGVPIVLDLVLRTSGEIRLSNFPPLQSGLAELIFLNKLFPDLTSDDVSRVIATYRSRQRRRGL